MEKGLILDLRSKEHITSVEHCNKWQTGTGDKKQSKHTGNDVQLLKPQSPSPVTYFLHHDQTFKTYPNSVSG